MGIVDDYDDREPRVRRTAHRVGESATPLLVRSGGDVDVAISRQRLLRAGVSSPTLHPGHRGLHDAEGLNRELHRVREPDEADDVLHERERRVDVIRPALGEMLGVSFKLPRRVEQPRHRKAVF